MRGRSRPVKRARRRGASRCACRLRIDLVGDYVFVGHVWEGAGFGVEGVGIAGVGYFGYQVGGGSELCEQRAIGSRCQNGIPAVWRVKRRAMPATGSAGDLPEGLAKPGRFFAAMFGCFSQGIEDAGPRPRAWRPRSMARSTCQMRRAIGFARDGEHHGNDPDVGDVDREARRPRRVKKPTGWLWAIQCPLNKIGEHHDVDDQGQVLCGFAPGEGAFSKVIPRFHPRVVNSIGLDQR